MVNFTLSYVSKRLLATAAWWRPITGWACTVNAWLILVILPLMGVHTKSDELYAMLAFDGLVIGLRGWEKLKSSNSEYSNVNYPPI